MDKTACFGKTRFSRNRQLTLPPASRTEAQPVLKEDLLPMAYRDFAADQLSRRSLLRCGAYLSAAGLLAQVPFGRALANSAAMWPGVAATV